LAQALFGYVNPGLILPRWVVVLGSGLSLLCFVGWRLFYSGVMLRAIGEERVLFLGNNALAIEIAQHLVGHPEFGMRVVGCVDDENGDSASRKGPDRLAGVSGLREVVASTKPDRIIVGVKERRGNVPLMDLLDLRFSGLRIEEAAATFESVLKRVSLNELRPAPLIYSGELGPRRSNLALQFAYSGLTALVAAILCAPLMLLVALAVKLSSRGPVLYRQTRVGRDGRRFRIVKFRTMVEGADRLRGRLEHRNEADGLLFKLRSDPRVTRTGRFLRRYSIDELPQILNVLRGEMSMVGPRPPLPDEVDLYEGHVKRRLLVKPGITGLRQVSGRSDLPWNEAIRLDLYYVDHWSPTMDLTIMAKTFSAVVRGAGAY